MTFDHPLMLWGLLGALIPLLVHLFDRRRARPLKFAAIDFVLRSQRRAARRLRLRRILLYALRTALFLAVPLALARPHRVSEKPAAVAKRGPHANAIVLDASFSMRYQLDGRSLFEAAQDLAREALASLGPEEPVTVMVCRQPIAPPAALGFDRGAARRAIDAARATFAPADLSACLQAAATALGESPLPAKRIFVATDLTQRAFHLDAPPPRVTTPKGEVKPEVVLLDAARGAKELPNADVGDLRIEPMSALGSRGYAFHFTVHDHASSPLRDLPVSLRIDGRVVAKGAVDVPAHGSTQKTLSYRFPEGGVVHGEVATAPDALADDDRCFFTLRVPREVHALVVDGAPSAVRFQDEAFFVDAALSAAGSVVHATTVDVDSFDQLPLAQGLDVVMLLNAAALPPARAHELAAFIDRGGGLFISLGDRVDPDAYDQVMAPLLPRPLRLLKTAAERGQPGAETRAARFSQVLWNHPAFSIFGGDAREGFTGARTYRYFLLEPGDASKVATLASYDDGAPALIEAARGRGRIVLYTSTVERSWSDWPIRTSFLPTVQRLAGYLAGALDEREVGATRVGEALRLLAPQGSAVLGVTGPDGRARALVPAQGDQPLQVAQTDLPGLYAVALADGAPASARGSLDFAVNVDPSESDLARADPKELADYFGEGTQTRNGAADGLARKSHAPAWTGLLALAAVILFAEGALLSKP